MGIKNFIKQYNETNLVVKICMGIILGILIALIMPNLNWVSIFGDLFVGSLKAIAPILVLILVISALAQGGKKSDGRFRTVIILYLLSTFLAAVSAVVFSYLFPITLDLNLHPSALQTIPKGVDEIVQNMLIKIVINPLSSITEGNYLGILFWAIISGIALKDIANNETKTMLQDLANGTSKIVSWIINLAPFGIMGLVFTAVSTSGIEIFTQYGKLLLLLVGCMLFVYLVTNPFLVYLLSKKNPYPLIFR
ncbi:cation:dicarboxylase symporter family transporter, partial [bacterium]|nr:cation:dicarboxylase symporter family transporter [bacterium]